MHLFLYSVFFVWMIFLPFSSFRSYNLWLANKFSNIENWIALNIEKCYSKFFYQPRRSYAALDYSCCSCSDLCFFDIGTSFIGILSLFFPKIERIKFFKEIKSSKKIRFSNKFKFSKKNHFFLIWHCAAGRC